MTKNDILDQVFEAAAKLELMQTVLNVLINTVEKEEANTQEKALHFAANQNMIGDFLHIVLDGVCSAVKILNKVQDRDKKHEDYSRQYKTNTPETCHVIKDKNNEMPEKEIMAQDKKETEFPPGINDRIIVSQIKQLIDSVPTGEDIIQ